MAITEHARDLPAVIDAVPDDDEIRQSVAAAVTGLAETVDTLGDRAKVLDRINLQAACNKFAPIIATCIFLVLASMASRVQVTPPVSW